MTIPKSIDDREFKKFRESLKIPNFTTVAVDVENTADNAIPVFFSPLLGANQTQVTEYQEFLNVAGNSTQTLLNYTAQPDQSVIIQSIMTSGDNVSVYTVELNDNIIVKKRSTLTAYNVEFNLNIELSEGDNLKVKATNIRATQSNYNATIKGIIYE